MKSKAVILAGGKGTRLMPLTEKIPKPMVPVAGISAFERIVNLLKNNGITDIAVTTMYLAEKIENVRVKNVNLKYYRETSPLGTAGCVKKILDELDDVFVVINGDDVCNFNIKAAVRSHIESGAAVTVLLFRTKDPTEYGNVILKDGIITAFDEKPSWSRTVSNLVNTGIYILNKNIFEDEKDGFLDFSKDMFPHLMEKGIKLHGIECEGFWYDIGDLKAYYECNFSFAPKLSNIIGRNVRAERNIKVNGCIVHDNVSIGEFTVINDSIICEGAVIGKNCIIGEGCVIGAGSVIDDNVTVIPGITVRSELYVGKGTKVMRNVIFGGIKKNIFSDNGITGNYGSDIDGEFCIKLGRSLSEIYLNIGVMSDGDKRADHLKNALVCGISGSGGTVTDLGEGFPSLSRFCITGYSLDMSIYVSIEDNEAKIKLYDKNSLKISHDAERLIEKKYAEQLPAMCDPKEITKVNYNELIEKYKQYLVSFLNNKNDKADICVLPGNKTADILLNTGIFSNSAKEKIKVLPDIISAEAENGEILSYWHIVCIILNYSDNKDLKALPIMIPQTVVRFLEDNGYDCVFYSDAESIERTKARSDPELRDPAALAVMLYDTALKTGKTLAELKRELPEFYVETQSLEYDDDLKAKCITELAERDGAMQIKTGGVKILGDGGSVIVIPKYEGGFRLFAEAHSFEAAKEMFFDVKKMIRDTNK